MHSKRPLSKINFLSFSFKFFLNGTARKQKTIKKRQKFRNKWQKCSKILPSLCFISPLRSSYTTVYSYKFSIVAWGSLLLLLVLLLLLLLLLLMLLLCHPMGNTSQTLIFICYQPLQVFTVLFLSLTLSASLYTLRYVFT